MKTKVKRISKTDRRKIQRKKKTTSIPSVTEALESMGYELASRKHTAAELEEAKRILYGEKINGRSS